MVLLIVGILLVVVALILGLFLCRKRSQQKSRSKLPKRGKYKFIDEGQEHDEEENDPNLSIGT